MIPKERTPTLRKILKILNNDLREYPVTVRFMYDEFGSFTGGHSRGSHGRVFLPCMFMQKGPCLGHTCQRVLYDVLQIDNIVYKNMCPSLFL